MKVGMVGFAGSGKSTAFQWLTGVKPDPAASQRGQIGMARLPDERLDWLSAQFKPKKTTPATVEFMDTPGLLAAERRDNPRRLAIQREADQHELGLLQRIAAAFEQGRHAAALGLKEDEEKLVRSFQLLTLKPELPFVNLGDARLGQPLPPDLLAL